MDQIRPVGPIGEALPGGRVQKPGAHPADAPSFKETLQGFMSEVNGLSRKAGESIEKMVAGEITDVHQVMNAMEEANVAFNLMMEIRNKVMDAYQEVMRLRM